MLTEIEHFIFGGNIGHDIFIFSKKGTSISIKVESHAKGNERNIFLFSEVELEYEQILLDSDEELRFPLPIIGAESTPINDSKWHFLFNASDIEWAFISKWPIKL